MLPCWHFCKGHPCKIPELQGSITAFCSLMSLCSSGSVGKVSSSVPLLGVGAGPLRSSGSPFYVAVGLGATLAAWLSPSLLRVLSGLGLPRPFEAEPYRFAEGCGAVFAKTRRLRDHLGLKNIVACFSVSTERRKSRGPSGRKW